MSFVISITNQKGGVGKTTTAVNVASILAKNNLKTLVVDFDPQAHASEHLGIKVNNQNQTYSVLEVLDDVSLAPQAVAATYQENLFVLPSSLKLGQFNQFSPQGRQFALKEVLQTDWFNQFEFVLIDCQPSLSLLTLNALTASDYVLLPVQAEFLALDGLSQLILTMKEVQQKLHPNLQVLGILLTMYDKRNRLSGEVLSELKKNFGQNLFESIIPRNVKLAEAPSFSRAIFDYDAYSAGAKAYQTLGQEILDRVYKKEQG